jgi:hypothetical protein
MIRVDFGPISEQLKKENGLVSNGKKYHTVGTVPKYN